LEEPQNVEEKPAPGSGILRVIGKDDSQTEASCARKVEAGVADPIGKTRTHWDRGAFEYGP
jgi:hypothetical protein